MAAYGLTWPTMASQKIVLWEWSQLPVCSWVTVPSVEKKGVPKVRSATLRGQIKQRCHLRLFHEYVGKRM